MSVKVHLDQLSDALADYTFAYLITVGDDYRAHTVAIEPVLVDGAVDVGAVGNSTRRNVTAHDGVTVVWPPREPGGYTLIVDGRGQLTDTTLTIAPATAVLHRKAGLTGQPAAPASRTSCGDDCVPLDGG